MVDKRVSSLTSSLKILLQVHRLSHAALEEKLGWTAGSLSRLLSGRTKMTLRHLVLLLSELDVPVGEFAEITFRSGSRLGSRAKRRPPAFGSSLWNPLDF